MGAECHRCGRDIYDECGHCAVVDERDRYRKALEEIAKGTMRPSHFVAQEALAMNQEDRP